MSAPTIPLAGSSRASHSLCALLLAILPALLLPGQLAAEGIPAFARRYGVTCSLCHNPAPRLNDFGARFAANGFRMVPGEETPGTVPTGDPLLTLADQLPLAIRLDAYLTALSGGGATASHVDLQTPWVAKLFSGGPIGDKVSYYLYFMLSERGEVAGLEDAYLQFDDIRGTGVSVLAGQFQVSDPMYKRELRLPYEDYQLYRLRVGDVRADLTYDRGVMLLHSPAERLDLAFQVVNGRGLDEAGADRRYDGDRAKNVALHAAYDLGFGQMGLFAYRGSESSESRESRLLIWGPNLTLSLSPRVELKVQGLRRTDSNPFFLEECAAADSRCDPGGTRPLEVISNGILAEMIWSPHGDLGRVFVSGLFNHVDANRPAMRLRLGEAAPTRRHQTSAVSLHYLLRRNVRWLGEVGWDAQEDRFRFTTGVSAAF